MDFPGQHFHKPVISSVSFEAVGLPLVAVGGPTPFGSASWPAANLIIYVPFALKANYLCRQVWWANGTAVSGTIHVGVLSVGGTFFVDGSAAQSGGSVAQAVTLGTPVLLTPGSYYMALTSSSSSSTFMRADPGTTICQFAGVAQQAGSGGFPATATLASLASNYVPVFGIASASVI